MPGDNKFGTLGDELQAALGTRKESGALRIDQSAVPGEAPKSIPLRATQPMLKGLKAGQMPRINATQFAGREGRQKRDIVIGLDFGTSCTKVVIQDPDTRDAWAVPFERIGTKGNVYLLPTRLTVDNEGWGSLAGAGQPISDLKVRLMSDPDGKLDQIVLPDLPLSARDLTSLYLALVLRSVRGWFLRTKGDIYSDLELEWQLNVGVPSNALDGGGIVETTLQVARAAWWLSLRPGRISMKEVCLAAKVSKSASFDPGIALDQIQIYPEIAAEVAGYSRSHARRNGLHLMVDVGASTLDVAMFRLHEHEQADRVIFVCTEVKPLGTYFLKKHRMESVQRAIERRAQLDDLTAPLENGIDELVKFGEDDLGEIDEQFGIRCKDVLLRVLLATKTRRAPQEPQFRHDSPTELPVFLCGGGSQAKPFRNFVNQLEKALQKNYRIGRFALTQLEFGNRFVGGSMSPSDQYRHAVAFGLSFRYLDLPAAFPPSVIADDCGSGTIERPETISKDQV